MRDALLGSARWRERARRSGPPARSELKVDEAAVARPARHGLVAAGPGVSRRGDPPSASIVQMSQCPSSAWESKAIRRPSGDQRGEPCQIPGPWVSCIGSDPSAAASQISIPLAAAPRLEDDPAAVRRKVRVRSLRDEERSNGVGRASRFEPVDVAGCRRPARTRGDPGRPRWSARWRRTPPASIRSGGRSPATPTRQSPSPGLAVDDGLPVAGPGQAADPEALAGQAARRSRRRVVRVQIRRHRPGTQRLWRRTRRRGGVRRVRRRGRGGRSARCGDVIAGGARPPGTGTRPMPRLPASIAVRSRGAPSPATGRPATTKAAPTHRMVAQLPVRPAEGRHEVDRADVPPARGRRMKAIGRPSGDQLGNRSKGAGPSSVGGSPRTRPS